MDLESSVLLFLVSTIFSHDGEITEISDSVSKPRVTVPVFEDLGKVTHILGTAAGSSVNVTNFGFSLLLPDTLRTHLVP